MLLSLMEWMAPETPVDYGTGPLLLIAAFRDANDEAYYGRQTLKSPSAITAYNPILDITHPEFREQKPDIGMQSFNVNPTRVLVNDIRRGGDGARDYSCWRSTFRHRCGGIAGLDVSARIGATCDIRASSLVTIRAYPVRVLSPPSSDRANQRAHAPTAPRRGPATLKSADAVHGQQNAPG